MALVGVLDTSEAAAGEGGIDTSTARSFWWSVEHVSWRTLILGETLRPRQGRTAPCGPTKVPTGTARTRLARIVVPAAVARPGPAGRLEHHRPLAPIDVPCGPPML